MNRKLFGVVVVVALSALMATACSADPETSPASPAVQEAPSTPVEPAEAPQTEEPAEEVVEESGPGDSGAESEPEENASEPVPEESVERVLGDVCADFAALGEQGLAEIVGDIFVDVGDTYETELDSEQDAYEAGMACGHFFGDTLGQMTASRAFVMEVQYATAEEAALDALADATDDPMLVHLEPLELGDDAYVMAYLVNSAPISVKVSYSVLIRQGNFQYQVALSENHPGDAVTQAPPEADERIAVVKALADALGPWEPTEG